MRSKSTIWDTFVVKCAFLSCHVSKDLYWQYEMFINILLLRIEVLGTVHNVSMNALMHAARGQYREVLSFLHQRIVPYGCQKYLHCCIYSSLIDWRVGGGDFKSFPSFPSDFQYSTFTRGPYWQKRFLWYIKPVPDLIYYGQQLRFNHKISLGINLTTVPLRINPQFVKIMN